MKIFHRYLYGSVLKIIGVTVLLVALLIVLFDVFSRLDHYLNAAVGYQDIALLSLLQLPQAIGYALGPASLFGATYVLSMLHANNEMIILANSGYSYRKVITPVLVIGLLLSFAQFAFMEQVAIPASREKQVRTDQLMQVRSVTDSRNVTLISPEGNYIIHARRYYDDTERLVSVNVFMRDADDRLSARIDATSAHYNGTYWVLHDARRYLINHDTTSLEAFREEEYHNRNIDMDPALFRNLSADISTMDLASALWYVRTLRTVDASRWNSGAADLADRILGNLTPLILVVISCSTVFTWRKNVLILSIIASLAISVVYFVMHMLSMILARQGLLSPLLGPLTPMLAMLILSSVSLIARRI
mgnify:CR=1 FL=1